MLPLRGRIPPLRGPGRGREWTWWELRVGRREEWELLSNELQLGKRTTHKRSVNAAENLTMIHVSLIPQKSTLDTNFNKVDTVKLMLYIYHNQIKN